MIDLLSLEDIAKDLRKSISTVRRLAQSGELPVITQRRRGGFYYNVPVQAYLKWKKHFTRFTLLQKIKRLSSCKGYLMTSQDEVIKEMQGL